MDSDKSPPPAPPQTDEDEKLMQSAEGWLISMCNSGRTSWVSDAHRVADFLQKFGNEKLGLNIPIDIDVIRERLLITDAEIRLKSTELLLPGSPSSSSPSSSDDVRAEPPAAAAEEEGMRLFIRRQLNKTDMDNHQNRLSMPCSQVDDEVLTAEEKRSLEGGQTMATEVVDPERRRYEVKLRLTKAGKKSCSYAIGKPWNDIKRDNGFREGMVLEVWSKRGDDGHLSFHLIIQN